MEINIKFIITTVDGKQDVQELPMHPAEVDKGIMSVLIQYAQIGLLKKEGSTFILIPASQIARVEVETPLVATANFMDAASTAKASGEIKKILL
jgi:hypothetical protein